MEEWQAQISVSQELAQKLIESQFDGLRVQSIRPFGEGWDNAAYLVNEEWIFRFPRREICLEGVRAEMRLLRELSTRLPVAIPVPRYQGQGSLEYPWPFFGYRRLSGRESCELSLSPVERAALVEPIAGFLKELHERENFERFGARLRLDPFGRLEMATRIPMTAKKLSELAGEGLIESPEPWLKRIETAREARPAQPKAIAHGDLHFRHLLVDERRRLAGVIDWGDLQTSDPAVDLQLYWSFLPPQERRAFLLTYGAVSDECLCLARVVAIFLAATLALYGRKTGQVSVLQEALIGLQYALAE